MFARSFIVVTSFSGTGMHERQTGEIFPKAKCAGRQGTKHRRVSFYVISQQWDSLCARYKATQHHFAKCPTLYACLFSEYVVTETETFVRGSLNFLYCKFCISETESSMKRMFRERLNVFSFRQLHSHICSSAHVWIYNTLQKA